MHVIRTKPSDTEAVLTITASEADLSPVKQKILKKLATNMKLAGFRAGKVPLHLVEKNLDQQSFQNEFLEEAMSRLYSAALDQENLRPVANPEVVLKKFVPFTTIEFTATVPVIGTIKIADYTKIKLSPSKITIDTKQVNDVIASLQQRMAERKNVDRPAKNGDEVTIDFKGVDAAGQAVNGAEGADYPLTLGSNTFIPGFEDHLIGLKAGESKLFDIPFPKDYGVKALQGKKVKFEVMAKSVQELVEPKADDVFAAKAGPFKTLAELKEDIKKQLTVERQQEANRNYEEELLQKIAAKSTAGVPKSLVDEQIERIEREEMQNLVYRGQTWEEHLAAEGLNAEQHKEQKRPAAEDRVKIGIILSEIAETEKITVSPEEFEVRLKLMRGQYQDATAQAELEKPEVQRDILARMMTEKTIEKLVGYASK